MGLLTKALQYRDTFAKTKNKGLLNRTLEFIEKKTNYFPMNSIIQEKNIINPIFKDEINENYQNITKKTDIQINEPIIEEQPIIEEEPTIEEEPVTVIDFGYIKFPIKEEPTIEEFPTVEEELPEIIEEVEEIEDLEPVEEEKKIKEDFKEPKMIEMEENIPEIIEIGENDEENKNYLENIFENVEKVEILKVTNKDIIESILDKNYNKKFLSKKEDNEQILEEIEEAGSLEELEEFDELEELEEVSSENYENDLEGEDMRGLILPLDNFPALDLDDENLIPLEEEEISESLEENVSIENIEDLFEMKEENFKAENYEKHEEIHEEIPRLPDEFYKDNVIKDELYLKIKNIESKKTNLKDFLERSFEEIGADKLALLINLSGKNNFMQTFQLGFSETNVEKIELDENNVIVQHIFLTERLVYVSDMEKTKHLFHNDKFEFYYQDIKSLFIYPVKIFGKIRSLILVGFKTDAKDKLEKLITILEENKKELRKNIIKLI